MLQKRAGFEREEDHEVTVGHYKMGVTKWMI
jgi:hypothetical protein